MKLETQRLIRIDGGNVMVEWTDIETGEKRYEGDGQVPINVRGPQGAGQVPVPFHFEVEALNVQDAAWRFNEALQEEGRKAAKAAVEQINGSRQKIQVAGPGDGKILQIGGKNHP